jgi:hypothetical protein
MTTSKAKAQVGSVKAIISPETEGYVDILQLPIDVGNTQTTLGKVITEFISLQHTLRNVSTRIEAYRITLKQFLIKKGYDIPKDDLISLLQTIQEIDILNPKDEHSLAIEHEGYIVDVININIRQILRNADVPSDIKNGYYRIEHGKIILDRTRLEESEGLE